MAPLTINLLACIVIVLCTTWAVLTRKVKTNSLEILALAMVNIGAAVGVHETLANAEHVSVSQLIIRVGLALACALYFIRVEVFPYLCKPFRRY